MCVNWGKYKTSNRLAALLRRGYNPIRSVQSHNTLESSTSIGKVQRGGTAAVLQGLFSKFVKKTGKSTGMDHTGLVRWSWYTMEREHGVRTRIIMAYAPVGGKDSGPSCTGGNRSGISRTTVSIPLLSTCFATTCVRFKDVEVKGQ